MLKIFNRNFLYTSFFFLYPLIIALTFPIRGGDLGVWTAMGMASIKAGHLVTQDTFSILPTLKMVYPSWGISLVYGAINLAANENGVVWLSVFHKLILLGFLIRVYFKYLKPLTDKWHLKNIIYILFFIYGGNILYTNRPSFVAIVPALLAFEIIHENFKLTIRQIAKLFFITVFWINIHASALLVLVMIGWKMAASVLLKHWKKIEFTDLKSFLIAGFFSCVALLINPFGISIFPYVLQTAQLSRQRHFTEWLSPFYFDDVFHSIVFFVWFGIVAFKFYKEIKKSNYKILISPYFLLCIMGLFSVRDTVWSYFFMFPIMIEEGQKKSFSGESKGNFINLVFVLMFLFVLFCLNPFKRPAFVESINDKRYNLEENIPEVETKLILAKKNKGPIFDIESSGYLLMRRVPNKTFLDARNIIFPDIAFLESDVVSLAKVGWEDVLKKYQFQFVLVDKKYVVPEFIEKISNSKDWKVLSSRKNYFLAERVE